MKNLQRELNHCFGDKIGAQLQEDGIFGSNTETALKRAQGSVALWDRWAW